MAPIPNKQLDLALTRIEAHGVIPDATTTTPSQAEAFLAATPTSVVEAWTAYADHLRKWFYNPDLEALRITLAVAASNFHKDCDPVWLFVLGPSGGDKSSININSIHDFPQVHQQGDITSKTFLSGYTGTANPSLLHKIGSGILSFKDFTTFCSKNADEKAAISGQLREIADGEFHKETGKGVPVHWIGKITIIAAATLEFENEWAVHRKMGERFVQVRLHRKDGVLQAESAQRQRGMEDYISKRTRELALAFFQCDPPISTPRPSLTDEQMTRVASMAEIVCHCRGSVPRNKVTNAICGRAVIENAGRISKALASIASNHAALFRRTRVTEEDMKVARRVALNTIPNDRSIILDAIPLTGTIGLDRLQLVAGLPDSSVAYFVAELEALGVIRVQHNQVLANEISLHPTIEKLWKVAFLPPQQAQSQDQAPSQPAVQPQPAAGVAVH